MVRSSWCGLALALLTATFLSPAGARGQNAAPAPPAGPSVPNPNTYNPLPDLPHPLDAPRSLLLPAPASPTSECAPLPGPYFENEPFFDDPNLPLPGWFAGAEIAGLVPHIKENITGPVQIGTNAPNQVLLPNAPLDWTVAPQFTLGYRLPSAFGEFALSYRGFATQGNEVYAGADGPAGLKSRLDLNQVGVDYLSREFSLWPNWDMTWHVGVRLSTVYYDSTSEESVAAAAAGSGIFQQHTSNNYWGIGPDAGVTLSRCFKGTGLAFLTRLDLADYFGRISQNYTETATATNASGQFLTGDNRINGSQSVPMINVQAGISYDLPLPRMPHSSLFLGYIYEYWWDIGRLNNSPGSLGEMSDQGIVFRAEFNF
jgi:hypothetical protein